MGKPLNNTPIYIDINSQYGVGNTDELLADEQAVLNALINILYTTRGERIFNPFLGTDVTKLLYEPVDPATAYLLELEIMHAVAQEPRCTLIRGETRVYDDQFGQAYEAIIAVRIEGLNKNTIFPLVLKRAGQGASDANQ
jgi:phage baseplate assembly protein W